MSKTFDELFARLDDGQTLELQIQASAVFNILSWLRLADAYLLETYDWKSPEASMRLVSLWLTECERQTFPEDREALRKEYVGE